MNSLHQYLNFELPPSCAARGCFYIAANGVAKLFPLSKNQIKLMEIAKEYPPFTWLQISASVINFMFARAAHDKFHCSTNKCTTVCVSTDKYVSGVMGKLCISLGGCALQAACFCHSSVCFCRMQNEHGVIFSSYFPLMQQLQWALLNPPARYYLFFFSPHALNARTQGLSTYKIHDIIAWSLLPIWSDLLLEGTISR